MHVETAYDLTRRLLPTAARRIVSASRHPPRPLGGLEAQRLRGQEVRNDIRQEACRSIIQELKIKEINESKMHGKTKPRQERIVYIRNMIDKSSILNRNLGPKAF